MATRRDVLKTGLATSMAAVFAGGALEAVAGARNVARNPARSPVEHGVLSRSSFRELLDERFSARGSATWVTLVLTSVRDLPQAERQGLVDSEDCFLLRFRGPARRPLEQGTYTLRHFLLGSFPMFLVPMGGSRGSSVYEAVINRPPLG